MKNLLTARLLALITVPVMISSLVLPTAAMAANDNSANLTSVSISGTYSATTAQIGSVLTATAVGKTIATTTTTYQWFIGLTVVSTTDTYTIQAGDINKQIIARINVSNATSYNARLGPAITVIPADSAPGITSATIAVEDANSEVVPDGTPEAYKVLTATANGISGFPTPTASYEWKSGTDIVGENSSEYTVEESDVGKVITVTITLNNGVGSAASATSDPTPTVWGPPTFEINSISGTAKVGQILTATYTFGSGFPVPTFLYQWMSGDDIVGVNSPTYTPVSSDIGKAITVIIVGTNDYGPAGGTSDPTANVVAAAAPPINVIFNANNGTGGWLNQFITAGKATSLLSNTYTRTGYTPNGWNTQADGNGTPYTNGQSVTLALNSRLTLFAKWTANPNTVTFNANGAGTSGIMNNQSISSGAATALTANTFTRTGYTFAGWATNSNGSGTTYSNGQSVTLTSGLTLFARWNAKTNTVFFNSNNGAGNRISQDIISDRATALRANSFTRTGYTFAGWASDSAGSAPFYANNAPVTITSGLNLFARWTKN
jgi:uncharacterized repeat protein (TIGR02543 family)